MYPTLEPELLQSFVAIADTGSFTAAAQRVLRTQSAVSMQMKRLEEMLERPLFARQGRTMQLTADGELLLSHARRILRAHQQALAAFVHSELAGKVTLGAPDDYASTFLPAVLARFAEVYPQVQVELVCDQSLTLLEQLRQGTLDMALVTLGHGGDGGVVLYRETAVWVAAAGHCVHEQDPLPLALFHGGCIFRRWALEALARQGRASRIAYTSLSSAGLEAAIRAGLAVGVLTRGGVRPGMRILTEQEGFPPLPTFSVALKRAEGRHSELLDCLEAHLLSCCRDSQVTTPARVEAVN